MEAQLIHAYTPLILWTGLGLLIWRWLPRKAPQLLGRSLYWVGIPIEIFTLARHTTFSGEAGLTPVAALLTVLLGLGTSALLLFSLNVWHRRSQSESIPSTDALTSTDTPKAWYQIPTIQGTMLLSSMIGNTGFVGLAIVPQFLPPEYGGIPAFYTVSQNILGTYGLGVLVASYCSDRAGSRYWWSQLKDLLTVPTLWAFSLGVATQSVSLPNPVENALSASIWIVIPCAFVLMGMRLSGLQDWGQLKLAVFPVVIKMLLVPTLVAIILTLLNVPEQIRLALVLMSGMPCAFASLILAEEYELNRSIAAGAIALSTLLLLGMLPLWITVLA